MKASSSYLLFRRGQFDWGKIRRYQRCNRFFIHLPPIPTWRDASSWMKKESISTCWTFSFSYSERLFPSLKDFRHHHSSFAFYFLSLFFSSCLHTSTSPQGIYFVQEGEEKKFNSTSPGNKSVSSSSVWENILLWKFLCGYFPPEEASRMIRKGDLDGKSHRGASAKAPGLQRNFRLVILA